MSTEFHLELCAQSTNHLFESLAKLNENIKILELILQAGLKNAEEQNSTDRCGSPDGEKARKIRISGNGSVCCCLCHLYYSSNRDNDSVSCNGIKINQTCSHGKENGKKKDRIVQPRLNKSASLRRDTILEKSHGTKKSGLSTSKKD